MSENDEDKLEDFNLTDPYEAFEDHTIYVEENTRGKIFGVKDKEHDKEFIRLLSKSKKPWQDEPKANAGFNLYSTLQIDKLFNFFKKIAKKLGWEVKESDKVKKLQSRLKEKNKQISTLRSAISEKRKILKSLREKQKNSLKSRIPEFQETLKKLKNKIKKAKKEEIPEKELQTFLKNNPWLLGAEYANFQPKKIAGSKNEFDFYLERYNGVNDIIEIKKISDDILREDNRLHSKVIQAVDQCIDYMEYTTAAAHSTVISRQEKITELHPRGKVIIGHNTSGRAREKLKRWNYRLNNIQILTYKDIFSKAKTMIKKIKKEEGKDD